MNSTNCSTNKLRHFQSFVKVLLFFVELLCLEYSAVDMQSFFDFLPLFECFTSSASRVKLDSALSSTPAIMSADSTLELKSRCK